MKFRGIKNLIFLPVLALLVMLCAACGGPGVGNGNAEIAKIPVKVLILPKFEVGEMAGDFPGEAQLFYEKYMAGGAEEYDIPGGSEGSKLYVKDGVALYVLGMGKVGAALGTEAVLSDERFDFSDAYILSTGCAGSAVEESVMGDVVLVTAAVDYDFGHHADIREMENKDGSTWFHDASYDSEAVVKLDSELNEKVYALIKDVPVKTTEKTRSYMQATFPGEDWAVRDPKVMLGTTITSDNFWKGKYDHENAKLMTEVYGCEDPFLTTEMEDIGVCQAAKRKGMLERLIVTRTSVNMDVFMKGMTPESLWIEDYDGMTLASDDNAEAADIFETAMENSFNVGSTIVDAILNNRL